MFITAGPSTKLFACVGGDIGGHVLREMTSRGLWGGGNGGHVLRETTSRGLCELVCPSHDVCDTHWGVCVYYCSTYYKPVREGGGGGMEDMCYERLRAEADVK